MSTIKTDSLSGPGKNEGRIRMEGSDHLNVQGSFQLGSDAQVRLPRGTTEQRPASPTTGMIRFNTTTGVVEVYNGTAWSNYTHKPPKFIPEAGAGGGGGGGGGADGSSESKAAASVTALGDAGVAANGVYWFDNGGGPYQAYAVMDSSYASKNWVMVFNLNTDNTSDHAGGVPDWYNTTFWQGQNEKNQASDVPWTVSAKTRAYDQHPASEILFVTHKRSGITNNSSDLQGFGIYTNDAHPTDSIQVMMTNKGENFYVSNGGRSSWQDYNPGYLNHNNQRPQIRAGDLFHTGNINGYNNQDDRLMFNVTNNWCSNNQARARITTAAGQNCTYGYTSGGMGIAHRHNGWGMYAAYDKVSAYCGGTEIYGSSSDGNNYTSESGGSYGPSCMGRYNGTVNYNMMMFVR